MGAIWDALNKSFGGFPKIRGTFLGVPIIRIIVYWGLYWGPHILGNYHFGNRSSAEMPMQDLRDEGMW